MAQTTQAPQREHSAHLALIALGFVGLGLPAGLLGAAWPSIEEDLHRATTDLTIALVCYGAGYFLFGALAGVARRHIGSRPVLVGAAIVAAAGLLASALAATWPVLLIGAAVLGSGCGGLDTGLNVAAALHAGARAVNALHACFAGGAAVGPLLLAAVEGAGGSWRLAYLALFGATALLTLAFIRWGSLFTPSAAAQAERPPAGPTLGPGRSAAVIAAIAAVAIVYVGSEVSAGQWGPSLIRERGASTASAGVWIAGFWAGLGGGRLVAAFVAGLTTARRLLSVSLVVVLAGAILLWWAPAIVVGNLGFVVLGFGMSAVFPTVVSLTPSWVGDDRAPVAIGMQIAGSAAGGLGFPVLIGHLAGSSDLEVVGPVITIGAALLLVMVVALQRLASPRLAGLEP